MFKDALNIIKKQEMSHYLPIICKNRYCVMVSLVLLSMIRKLTIKLGRSVEGIWKD